MTKFKTDDFLGKVVKNTRMFCSIGLEPIKDIFQLRFAAGGNKFSQLCGFIFDSANENIDYPRFAIAFVCKLRSKIYRQQDKNPSMWYIFKKISKERVDVLDAKQLLVNYGFDVKKFFMSDMFKAAIPAFEKTLRKGIEDCKSFAEKLNSDEAKEAAKFIKAIEESMSLLKTTRVNDKYYKLNDLDAIDAEVAKLTKKSDDEKKKELDAKTAAIHQDAVNRMASAKKYSDKAAKNDYIYQRLHDEDEITNEKYHTDVAGDQRDIDDENPLRRKEGPNDPDYVNLNSSAMDRIVVLNATIEDKHAGEILFINRPKKLFEFNRAGYYKSTDSFLPVSRKNVDEMKKFLESDEMQKMQYYNDRTKKISDFNIKLITFDTFIHKFQYKKGDTLKKNIDALDESSTNESFDQFDWKDGSLTGKGVKQAVDSFKAQDGETQTTVIYDRATRKFYNIVDVHMAPVKSGHGIEFDIDTSKSIKSNANESTTDANEKDWKPVGKNGNKLEINDVDPFPEHMIASVERIGNARSGKWQVYIYKQPLLATPVSTCSEANDILSQWTNKFWKDTKESEEKNVDKKEVSEKEAEKVKFESMLNDDIDKALEEIYG